MQRQGHKLTIAHDNAELVATCECGRWHRAVTLPDDADFVNLVGVLGGKHERHLERLGRPVMSESAEGPLMPPST